jgi:hypothetical protein
VTQGATTFSVVSKNVPSDAWMRMWR